MKRNVHLDNIRGVAIVFTCFAHFIALNATNFNWLLNVSIYAFHMPLFAFASGQAQTMSKKSPIKKALIFLSQYCMAQLVCLFFWPAQVGTTAWWIIPAGINWFFLSLVFWQLSILLVRHLSLVQLKAFLLLSLAASLLSGFVNLNWEVLSLGRTLYFYPFFLLGVLQSQMQVTLGGMSTKKSWRMPICFSCLTILIVTELFIIRNISSINRSWMFGRYSYLEAEYTIFIRLGLMALATVWIFFLFYVLPKRKIRLITWFGQNTLSIYFLHGLVYTCMIYARFSLSSILQGEWVTVFCLLFTFFICVISSIPFVFKSVQMLLNLPFNIVNRLLGKDRTVPLE